MTLAQRLLVAIGIVTVASTLALGAGVREAWRQAEEERFRWQLEQAFSRLEHELRTSSKALTELVGPLCRHDPIVDSTLVDLRTGRLDAERRLSLSLRVPKLKEAFRLDELVLFTEKGEILGMGAGAGGVGRVDARLSALLATPAETPSLRTDRPPLALQIYCARREGGVTVGLYAARHLSQLLADVGRSHGVELSLTPPPNAADRMLQRWQLPELGGVTIVASQSRLPLVRALRRLDVTILALGLATFAAALVLSVLLSRGLARPSVDLSRQARAVVGGEPTPVRARGGRELEELADSFNRAIGDLAALRRRLAATERIAARREIARRVAHEIKNPLSPIRAAVETLRRLRARQDPAFDDYFDEATRTVLDEVARISNIVTEFTRFARLPPPRPEPMDLAATTRRVVALHASSGATLTLEAGELPEINADRDQMVQVLTNLIQNAVEAARQAPTPKVQVELSRHQDRVIVQVQDNGPGVPADLKPHLFEPYVTGKPEGTGLGLSITHRIVVEHGGEIRYEDAPGGGALFVVELPIAGPSLLADPPSVTATGV